MENSVSLSAQAIWAGIIGFLLGAAIVWLLARMSKGGKGDRLQKAYDELKKSHADYQRQVNEHFAKTADAVDNLTTSYQKVFSHLSTGAETLMDKETLALEREKRQGKTITLAYLSDAEGRESAQAVAKETVLPVVEASPEKSPPPSDGVNHPSPAAAKESPPPATAAKAGDSAAEKREEAAQESIAAIKRHLHDDSTAKKDQ